MTNNEDEPIILQDDDEDIVEPIVVVSPRIAPSSSTKSPVRRRNLSNKKTQSPKVSSVEDIPNYESMEPKEKHDIRNKFRIKLDMLKTDYPSIDPPHISDEMTLNEVHEIYETYLNRALAIENLGFYTMFLFIAFLALQWIVERLFRIDMSGFAEIQAKGMVRYRRLLIKLGERRKLNIETNWGPEVSLIIAMLIQAAIFAVITTVCGNQSRDEKVKSVGLLNNAIDSMMDHVQTKGQETSAQPLHEKDTKGGMMGGIDPSALLGGLDIGKLLGGFLGGGGGARTKSPSEEYDQ